MTSSSGLVIHDVTRWYKKVTMEDIHFWLNINLGYNINGFLYRGAIKWNVNLMSNRFSAIRVFMCIVIQYVTSTNAKPCDINDGQQWSVQLISANILWRLCTQIQLSYNIWLREVPFISRASPWIIVVHGGKTGRRNIPYFFPGACLVNLLAPGRFVWNLCK